MERKSTFKRVELQGNMTKGMDTQFYKESMKKREEWSNLPHPEAE